jgi:hypothetical protein
MRKGLAALVALPLVMCSTGVRAQCSDCEEDFNETVGYVHRMNGMLSEYSLVCEGGGPGHGVHDCEGESTYSVGRCNLHTGCGDPLESVLAVLAENLLVRQLQRVDVSSTAHAPAYHEDRRLLIRDCSGGVAGAYSLSGALRALIEWRRAATADITRS